MRALDKLLAGLLCCAACLLVNTAAASDPARTLLVMTRDGPVRGTQGVGVRVFKGIPFAAPPSGSLRWAMPAPVQPWTTVRDATQYRSACPQVVRFSLTEASDDEDCLYLNVAVPELPKQRAAKPAVLVWIHGGAYVGGSANIYPLDFLARKTGVVVVSINYRLGVFGFMPHPAFEAAHNGGYAFEDQRQALRWVQRNIAAFGGDPANVTIAGESAGAASVCMQLFAPQQATGLFHKGIIQSAGCTLHQRTVAEGQRVGVELAKQVGCADTETALACLRATPVPKLLEAQTAIAARNGRAFSPSVGSDSLPQQGAEALASGNFVRVPIINGGTRDEMRLYVGYDVVGGAPVTPENYPDRLNALYGANAAAVLARYPLSRYPSAASALGTAMSDFMPGGGLNNCLFLRTAKLASRHVPVYQYEFADRGAPAVMPDPGFEMGAVHSAELPYQFPHFSNNSKLDTPALGAASQRLALHMAAYWGAFARSGKPDARGLPRWSRFRSDQAVLRLDASGIREYDAGAEHHCEFWQSLYSEALAAQ